MKRHPGIRIDKIPVTATIGGGLFAVGILIVALVGVPAARELLIVTLPGGVLFAAVLYWWRSRS